MRATDRAKGHIDLALSEPRPGRNEKETEEPAQNDPEALRLGADDAAEAVPSAGGGGPVSPEDIEALQSAAGMSDGTTRDFPASPGAVEHQAGAEVQEPPSLVDSLPATEPFELTDLVSPSPVNVDAKRVTMLNDVNLRVKLQLGATRMLVEDVLKLGEGSVVELNKLAGDPIDVLVNDRLIARGEVLVLNDNFCVRISEVLSRDPHRVTA